MYRQLSAAAYLAGGIFLAAVLALTLGGFCLGSFVQHLLGGRGAFARQTLPWATLPWEAAFSAIRGLGYGAGLHRILGFRYAIVFGILVTFGQVFAYSRGMRPAIDYAADRRPRLSRRQFWGTVVRTVGFMATALICSFFDFSHHVDHAWWFAIRVGLVIGIVTGVGTTVNPYIEYYADNLPERRLGVFGIGLILCGFSLQSFQYWLALFDLRLTQVAGHDQQPFRTRVRLPPPRPALLSD